MKSLVSSILRVATALSFAASASAQLLFRDDFDLARASLPGGSPPGGGGSYAAITAPGSTVDAAYSAPPSLTGNNPWDPTLNVAYGPSLNVRSTPGDNNSQTGGRRPDTAWISDTTALGGARRWQTGFDQNRASTVTPVAGQRFAREILTVRTTSFAGAESPAAWGALDAWAVYNIQDGGGFTRPQQFALSSQVLVNISSRTGNTLYGFGLGFFSATPHTGGAGVNNSSWTNFTGLVLGSGDTSTVRLVVDGVATGVTATLPGYADGTWGLVAYSVDTATGALTNLTYNGTAVALTGFGVGPNPANNVFTNARTAFTGVYTAVATPDPGFGNFPKFDNFALVPEPATAAWLAGALAALIAFGRRVGRPGRS